MALGALLIVGIADEFNQWLTDHRLIHLGFSAGLLLIACAFFALIPNWLPNTVAALGLVVLLGIVGTILNQTLVAIPLLVICILIAGLLIKWKGSSFKSQ